MAKPIRGKTTRTKFLTVKTGGTDYTPEFRFKLFRTLEGNLTMAAAYLEADYKKSFPDGAGLPSAPGSIPNVQTGHLRKTITWDTPRAFVRRIGSSLKPTAGNASYAFYLEMGTGKMAARPWLNPGLDRNRKVLARFIGTPMR